MKEFSISKPARKELLSLARCAILHYLETGRRMNAASDNPELLKPAAVFVTLTKAGMLRGCIGMTEPQEAAAKAVGHMAVAAATQDPRFPPVTRDEMAQIRIEISVLSPLVRVKSADDVRPGIDGVAVRSGRCCGLFLPQVWEHFSTKEEFLGELCCQKAGLHPEAWKDPATELYTFTVVAFEE